ncbi:MAG: pyridoxal phosphate-dependent aminotransferase [Ignavibacteria bacterium]
MSLDLSKRVESALEAQTLAISNTAKKMKAAGIDVVSLSVGEPDFDTPLCAKEAAIRAINENFTHYTDSNGIAELRENIAKKFREENGIQHAIASNVIVSGGAKQCIYNTLMALCNEGDEVIILAPYWVSYPAMAVMCGARPIILSGDYEHAYKVRPEDLRKAITPKTKCVILNSPSNPTGMMYTEEEIRAFGVVIAEHDCYLLSDEIYEKLTYGEIKHFSPGAISELSSKVITVNGVSKAYAMTGWRIGYLHAPDHVFREISKVQGQSTSHPSSIAQKAALAALQFGSEDVIAMHAAFSARKSLVCSLLSEIPGLKFHIPDGAFYVFISFDDIQDDVDFCAYLLEEFHVALVPGDAFGCQGALRISFAASEETLRTGIDRLARGLIAYGTIK